METIELNIYIIKITMSHSTPNDQELAPNCSCQKVKSIPYLDTSCEIKAGKIVTDLYRKPTDQSHSVLESIEFVWRRQQEIKDYKS